LLVLYGILVYSDLFYQMLKSLSIFDPRYDIYIYDYRGYWRSGCELSRNTEQV